ncbi:MAG: hypothetical protein C0519_15945, partial [Hyphomicrobium sp.]
RAMTWKDAMETPVDSAKGMTMLLDFARSGGFVLSERHKCLAEKYGLDVSGVVFTEPVPLTK